MRPQRGEVWLVDLDPVRGHEQGGKRPVLVISVDRFNEGPAGLVIVVPLTSRKRGIPSHICIDPPEGGLQQQSFALVEAIRSISKTRLVRPLRSVSSGTLEQIEVWMKTLLGL